MPTVNSSVQSSLTFPREEEIIGLLKDIKEQLITANLSTSKFLNIAEVSRLLRITVPTVYKLTSQKRIPFKKVGKRLVFVTEDVIAWVKNLDN